MFTSSISANTVVEHFRVKAQKYAKVAQDAILNDDQERASRMQDIADDYKRMADEVSKATREIQRSLRV